MRIAHVVSTFPPYRGGMGNAVKDIVERAARLGLDVRVVTPRSHAGESPALGEPFDPKPLTIDAIAWFGNAAWCPTLNRSLEDVDIVQFHWPFIGGCAPVLRWRGVDARRRLIVHYHMDLINHGWRGAVFAAYQHRALPRLLTIADRIVVSSLDYARSGALAPYLERMGVRLAEIPFAVDGERFHPSVRSTERRASDALSVLFVGGLDRAHAFKGLPVLLDAIMRVDGLVLRVVGDGDLRASYEDRSRQLGIADRVTFFGSLSSSDLVHAYQEADVCVLPSTERSEAFGLVLLEAMACGTPVVASNLPGVRTVVRDGATGVLVPPGDAAGLAAQLRALRDDRGRVRVMGAAARAHACDAYGWARIAPMWQRCYDALRAELAAQSGQTARPAT